MRLIDADILEDELRDSVSDNSMAIYILNEAPTVQAIPIGVLDKIRAEISKQEIEYRKQNDRCGVGLDMALRIIDKHIGDTE